MSSPNLSSPLPPACDRCDELLSNALDAALTAPEQSEVDAHLAECAPCVGRMRSYAATVGALRELGEAEQAEAPPPVPESLVARILAARVAVRVSKRRSG